MTRVRVPRAAVVYAGAHVKKPVCVWEGLIFFVRHEPVRGPRRFRWRALGQRVLRRWCRPVASRLCGMGRRRHVQRGCLCFGASHSHARADDLIDPEQPCQCLFAGREAANAEASWQADAPYASGLREALVALTLYDRIRVINYVRQAVAAMRHPQSGQQFASTDALRAALLAEPGWELPSRTVWEPEVCSPVRAGSPLSLCRITQEFLHPVLEDDGLLAWCTMWDEAQGDDGVVDGDHVCWEQSLTAAEEEDLKARLLLDIDVERLKTAQ